MSAGEWIAHDGKGMPVDGDVIVDVLLRCETPEDFQSEPCPARDFAWTGARVERSWDITHYKVIAND